MKKRSFCLYSAMIFVPSLVLLPADLLAGSLHVVIQGQQQDNNSCPSPPTPCEIVISNSNGTAKTYSTITIKGKDGMPAGTTAKVVAVDDIQDRLELVNATIAPVTGAPLPVQGDISFWADFTAPPSPGGGANVKFERVASGKMRRGANAAQGDWFKVTGWVNDNGTGDDEIQTFQEKVVCCLQPVSSGDINLPTDETWSSGLTSNRVMKAQFWFGQKQATDRLHIDFVRVKTSAVAGDNKEMTGVFDCYAEEFIKNQIGKCENEERKVKEATKGKSGAMQRAR